MDVTRRRRATARRDRPAESGTGVPCAEAQADGVPCFELGIDCEDCDRPERVEEPPPDEPASAEWGPYAGI